MTARVLPWADDTFVVVCIEHDWREGPFDYKTVDDMALNHNSTHSHKEDL